MAGAGDPHFHRCQREHGGAPQRLGHVLTEIAGVERVDTRLDDFNPGEVREQGVRHMCREAAELQADRGNREV